jgi:hypothetical protein
VRPGMRWMRTAGFWMSTEPVAAHKAKWSSSVDHDCEVLGVLSLPNQADDERMLRALQVPE